MAQIPTAIGLLVCEKSVVEEGTKNITLVNCFSIQKVQRVPSEPRQFTVFASLIDGDGEISLEVVVNRLEDGAEMYKRARSLVFDNRLQEVRFIFRESVFVSGPRQLRGCTSGQWRVARPS